MLEVRFNQPLTLDPRGRITLPARLAEALRFKRIPSLVFMVVDEHLCGYTPDDFRERVEAPLGALHALDRWEAEKQRLFLAMNTEVDVDAQGRIVLPQSLRDEVGLERDVIAISLLDRIELWDAKRFAAWYKAARERAGGAGG